MISATHKWSFKRVQIRIVPKTSEFLDRYRYEVETLQKFNHPFVLKIVDLYEDDNTFIYVQDSTQEGQNRITNLPKNEDSAKTFVKCI